MQSGPAPTANIPEATELAPPRRREAGRHADERWSSRRCCGIPTTAHILGGAAWATRRETGVIDHRHRVFGYDGLYVIDGSAVSANPGVNPSLTIAALAERAMTFIPPKGDACA